ncbi:MAG: hypothetical protein AAFZ15_13765 [Bacteroidota bacterium]
MILEQVVVPVVHMGNPGFTPAPNASSVNRRLWLVLLVLASLFGLVLLIVWKIEKRKKEKAARSKKPNNSDGYNRAL